MYGNIRLNGLYSMNDRVKNWLIVGLTFSLLNGMFWFVYSFTKNIVSTIGACAGMGFIIAVTVYMLGNRKTS